MEPIPRRRTYVGRSREDYFAEGRSDRIAGKPCRSANGGYLDGWYSVPNPPSPIYNKGKRHA